MAKNEIATVDTMFEGAVMDVRPDFLKDTARGSEQVGVNELTLPRLSIIQDISPQRKKNEPEYIEGATEGMVFNTITHELFPSGVILIPVYMEKEFVIWKDRKKGGGFAGAYPTEAEANAAKCELENPNDYEVLDTHQHYCLMVKPGSTMEAPILEEVVVSMSKSQMKVSRNLNTLVNLAGGDRFSKMYASTVVQDENKAGDKFFNWKVLPKGFVSKPMYERAEKTYEAVSSGLRKVERDASVEKHVDQSTGQGDAADDFVPDFG